ncbi:MAG TPA: S16 family serine protease [Trebonia sp.]|jgi:PDZ domain-containing protein|nr:S16 family serine protease [Trebonia sp.]
MSRRSLTLLIAGLAALVAIGVSVLVPVPYVILMPGPTLNTLGADSSGKPLISISGHQTYRTSGNLNMVTVSYTGDAPPDTGVNIFQALRAWLDSSEAVVPATEIFPAGQSVQQTQSQDTAQMAGSQEQATAAALTALHIAFVTTVSVVQTEPGTPAAGVLKAGDVIKSVNGEPITGASALTTLITAHPAGTVLHLVVVRGGKNVPLSVGTKEVGGHPIIGVTVQEGYKFPFTVSISVGNIGGPSAGMMFALGIIDKITSLNLTGGKFIAGTGEITAAGAVQPIGGIQQKMVGARDAGATIFLTPAGNCADTAGAVPSGLRVVKVSTLSQAIADLEAIKAGKSVPSC